MAKKKNTTRINELDAELKKVEKALKDPKQNEGHAGHVNAQRHYQLTEELALLKGAADSEDEQE